MMLDVGGVFPEDVGRFKPYELESLMAYARVRIGLGDD